MASSGNDLRIQIKGTFDLEATKSQLQSQLNQLGKQLTVTIGVDKKDIDSVAKQVKELQSQIQQGSKDTKIIDKSVIAKDVKDVEKEVGKLYTSINEAVKEFSKLGTVKFDANLDPASNDIKSFTLQVTKANNEVEKLKFALYDVPVTDNGKLQQLFYIQDRKVINDTQKIREKQLQLEHQIDKKIEDQNKKLQHQIDLFKRQMQVNIQNLQRTHGRFVNNNAINELNNALNNLSTKTPHVNQEMANLSMRFKEIQVDAKSAAGAAEQAGMSFGEMISTAMVKFPVWMIASTAFYGTIRALRTVSSILIEIDTQLVEMQKVMDEGTNFERILQSSIELAEKFSVTIQDINDAMVGFARAGFSEEEIIDLAGVSAALQQISDLSPEESMNTLIAAMVQFNVASEDAIQIADRLNEVDNNYSVTVRQLSESLSRAGDTAQTFGISLENLLGYTTAIATTTRESGSVIGNALKSIASRITTLEESREILTQLGIEIENADGSYRRVEEILSDLASIWNDLSNSQQQHIAVTIAGRYQLSRFIALMNNWEIAMSASEDAMNSHGSAMSEVEKRSDSLEARLARLRNAVTELALQLGESGFLEALTGVISGLTGLSRFIEGTVNKFGLLPTVLTATSLALIVLNSKLREFVREGRIAGQTGLGFIGTLQAIRTQAVQTATSLDLVGKAMNGIKMLGRGLLAGVGLSLALGAVGWVIEKIVNSIREHRQAIKDLEEQQRTIVKSYAEYGDEIQNLIARHQELSEMTNLTNEQQEEYYNIAERLSHLMPNLVDHIDEYGRVHLKTGEALEKELEYAEELVAIAQSDMSAQYYDRINELLKERKDILEQIQMVESQLEMNEGYYEPTSGIYLENFLPEEEVRRLEMQLIGFQNNLANTSIAIREEIDDMITNILKLNQIQIDDRLAYQIENLKNSLDFSDMSAREITTMVNAFTQALVDLYNALQDPNASIGALQHAEQQVINFGTALGMEEESIYGIIDALSQQANAHYNAADAVDAETDALDENADTKLKNASVTEILFDVTSDELEQLKEAIRVVALLSDAENLNSRQKALLTEATQILENAYPHLTGAIADNINMLWAEIDMLDQLNSASGTNAYVMMTNQDNLTKSTVEASNQRILALKNEAKALQDIVKSYLSYQEQFGDPVTPMTGFMSHIVNVRIPEVNAQLSKAYSTRREALYGAGVVKRPSSSSRSSSKGSKGKSGSKKSSKDTVREREIERYVTDKYAQAVENLEYRIAQSNARLNDYITTSQKYRDELETQIKLFQEQAQLANNEIKRLEQRNKTLKSQLKSMGDFNKLSSENKEKYNEIAREIDQNISKINRLKKTALDASEAIEDANRKIRDSYNQIADTVIDLYKELIQIQRNEAIKAIEKELEAFENAHRRKMDKLDEELEAYEKIINEKLKLLDQEIDEENWQEQLAEKQRERQELLAEHNKWMLDDSLEGRKRTSELKEQIEALDVEIAQMMTNRERELRRRSLEQQLKDKQEQINRQREMDNEELERQRERLNQQREEINQHYEDLLNDERKFAKMREDILKGNVANIKNELNQFANFVKSNMSSIGKSISQNLLDKIKEAQNLLNQINKAAPKPNTGKSGSSSSNKSSSSSSSKSSGSSSSSKTPTVGGKAKVKSSNTKAYLDSYGRQVKPWKDQARAAGIKYDTPLYVVNKRNGYVALSKTKRVSDAIAWVKTSDVIGLKSGGYTGNWPGNYGKLAFLHQKEQVLNADDTENLLKSVKLLNNFKDLLRPIIKPPQLPKIAMSGGDRIVNISMPVTIENLNGTQEGAMEFLDVINRRLTGVITKV